MTEALSTIGQKSQWLVPEEMDSAVRMATAISRAGIGSPTIKDNAEACLMVMGHGATLGYTPIESVQVFHVVKGKGGSARITMEATAQRARAMSHPDCISFDVDADDSKATVTIHWKEWSEPKSLDVTIDEARRARWGMAYGATDWDDNSSWAKTPSDMLVARATTRAIRRWVPFVLGQTVMYSPEEILEVEPEKNISPGVEYVEAEEVTEPVEAEAVTKDEDPTDQVEEGSPGEEPEEHGSDDESIRPDTLGEDDDLELIMEDDEEPPVNRQEILTKIKDGCKYFHGGDKDGAAKLYRAIFTKKKKHPEKCDVEILIEVLSALEEASLQDLNEEQLMESI